VLINEANYIICGGWLTAVIERSCTKHSAVDNSHASAKLTDQLAATKAQISSARQLA